MIYSYKKKLDDSHKCNVEWNLSAAYENILWDPIYREQKKAGETNLCMLLEVSVAVLCAKGQWLERASVGSGSWECSTSSACGKVHSEMSTFVYALYPNKNIKSRSH